MKKSHKLALLAGMVGVLALAGAVSAYLLLRKKKTDDTSSGDVPVPPTPTPSTCIGAVTAMKPNVRLQASDGRYLTCNDPGAMFTSGSLDSEGTWVIEKSPLAQGKVQIKNVYHNRYLSVADDNTVNAATTPDKLTKREAFTMTCTDASSTKITLQSINSGFLGISGWNVIATAGTAGADQTFTLILGS